MERKQIKVKYTGHVQGVGFRYTVRQVATGFEVSGTIKNMPDGSVDLIAEGAKDELEAFCAGIRESGLGSLIRNEEISWSAAAGQFRGFVIAG